MGAANIKRTANVATTQTRRNLSPVSPAALQAREGQQQRGSKFERFMQEQAGRQRAIGELNRRASSPFG